MENNITSLMLRKAPMPKTEEELQKLAEAIKMRDDYIASLPPERKEIALAMQAEIDRRLDKAGNLNNRLTVINEMMMESFHRLKDAWNELRYGKIDNEKAKFKQQTRLSLTVKTYTDDK